MSHFEANLRTAALDAAREAVVGVWCPHGEAVNVRPEGTSQFAVDAHCGAGEAAAKRALAAIAFEWDDA